MPGSHYRTEDFLLDDHFQQWVKSPDAENNAYWQKFLSNHPEARQEIEKAKHLILRLDFHVEPRPDATKERIKSAIEEAIRKEASLRVTHPNDQNDIFKRPAPPLHRQRFRVAATVTGLILLVSACLTFFASENYTEYATGYGETKTLVLPDRSIVTLNANSSLRIKEDRWENVPEREVWLMGEAFFEVEKKKTTENDLAKFVVHTGKVDVEVVGTRFNVNARRSATEVVLSSGQVRLNIQRDAEHAFEEVLMAPGELVAVPESQKVDKRKVDPAHYTAWTENKLIFENTSVAKIKQLIEDNYGLKLVISPSSLLKKAFTGAAPADDLNILLGKLSVVYNLEIIRDGDEILLKEK